MLAIEALSVVQNYMTTLSIDTEACLLQHEYELGIDEIEVSLLPFEFIKQKLRTTSKLLNDSDVNNTISRTPTKYDYLVTDFPDAEPFSQHVLFDSIIPDHILKQNHLMSELIKEMELDMYWEITIWPGLIQIYETLHDALMEYQGDLDEIDIDIENYYS